MFHSPQWNLLTAYDLIALIIYFYPIEIESCTIFSLH